MVYTYHLPATSIVVKAIVKTKNKNKMIFLTSKGTFRVYIIENNKNSVISRLK